LLALGFQMAGYYMIYLITPNSVQWQLDYSLERVLLQIYPSFLFLFFVFVRDIQVALNFKGKIKQVEYIP